jgi:hypothetical protein
MVTQPLLDEYLAELRLRVCSHCIERPQGGPPCAVRGKLCGLETHLEKLIAVAHAASSACMDPYVDHLHNDVCTVCNLRTTRHCPCPLDYLLPLAIEAVDAVDERHQEPAAIS